MKDFYSTFEANKKRYEEENTDTVDILFSMVNFDAFKKKMNLAKRGMIDVESDISNAAD